jgi:chromosome partitioning protein
MSLTLAVIGQRGEPGKTTTAVNVAAAFAYGGKRVLMVDADPRAGLGRALGVMPEDTRSVGSAMLRQLSGERPPVQQMVYSTDELLPECRLPGTLDAFLADPYTSRRAESTVAESDYRSATVLCEVLDHVRSEYDVTVIDTPPVVSALSAAGLAASDVAVAVSGLSRPAWPGVVMIKANVEAMAARTEGRSCPRFLGTVLNKVPLPAQRTLPIDTAERQVRLSALKVFDTRIHCDVLVPQAWELGVPVCVSHPQAPLSSAYRALAGEIAGRVAQAVA